MHKVRQMLDPANCLICGRGNIVDHPEEEHEFWAIDTERDVNWGDNAYICKYCCFRIAEFSGYVPVETAEELERTIKKKNREIHNLESRLEVKERRLDQVTTGLKVMKAEKTERKKTVERKKKRVRA